MRGKLSLMLLLVPLCSFLIVCDRDRPVEPPAELSVPLGPGLYLGPVEGLTTAWHPVPQNLALPRGQVASFRFVGPDGMVVAWVGAREVEAGDGVSTATCSLDRPGQMEVRVDAVFPGGRAHTRVCRFAVLDVRVDDITVREVRLSARQPDFDSHSKRGKDPGAQGTSVNELTMSYFFGDESIAALTEIGPGHFVTSVRRSVRMSIDVDPPAFAPLMEWRVNRRAIALGETATQHLADQGTYEVTVGPVRQAYLATIETYEVEITSHSTGVDRIAEGGSVTFTARTTPPGYERYVTWLGSTKYGGSDPIMGTGPDFKVTFGETWGRDAETGGRVQWLGVRADEVIFNQDSKCPAIPSTPAGPVTLSLVVCNRCVLGFCDQGEDTGTVPGLIDCALASDCTSGTVCDCTSPPSAARARYCDRYNIVGSVTRVDPSSGVFAIARSTHVRVVLPDGSAQQSSTDDFGRFYVVCEPNDFTRPVKEIVYELNIQKVGDGDVWIRLVPDYVAQAVVHAAKESRLSSP